MKSNIYHEIPYLLWNSIFIMEFHIHYGIPYLLWNPIFIMEFQSYYGSFQNAFKSDEIRQSQNDMKKKNDGQTK